MNSLQLPAEALERIWKRTGHLVPSELNELVLFLREVRDAHKASYTDLRREYESYVQTCKTFNLPGRPYKTTKTGQVLDGLRDRGQSSS